MPERAIPPNATLFRTAAYAFFRMLFRAALRFGFRTTWIDWRKVPGDGPVLIVANHESYIDPPAIGGGIRHRQCAYLAREGLFRNRVIGFFIRLFNSFPVGEGGELAAVRAVLSMLEQGHAVVLFPEGSRTATGEMGAFKRGAEVLLRKAKCPVVPAAIAGAYDAWPRSRKYPRIFRSRIRVIYGDPISYDELFNGSAEPPTQQIERAVRALHQRLASG